MLLDRKIERQADRAAAEDSIVSIVAHHRSLVELCPCRNSLRHQLLEVNSMVSMDKHSAEEGCSHQ